MELPDKFMYCMHRHTSVFTLYLIESADLTPLNPSQIPNLIYQSVCRQCKCLIQCEIFGLLWVNSLAVAFFPGLETKSAFNYFCKIALQGPCMIKYSLC